MKRTALALTIILALLFSAVAGAFGISTQPEENTSTTKAPMPQAISGVKAAVANGKIYVMTGSFNYEYDPATNNWTTKTPMPTLKHTGSFAITACENKIYVIGGANGSSGYLNYLSTNEMYDPSTDTWETKQPMPTSRRWAEANTINGKIYVIGGETDNYRSIQTSANEVYDPATYSWTTKKPAANAIAECKSAVVDDKIYIIDGTYNQIYDTENDVWTLGTPPPNPAIHAAAGAITGVMAPKRIYVVGGGIDNTSNAVHIYDPLLDNWTSGVSMPTNRSNLAVAVVNDTLYAIGGYLGWVGPFPPWVGYSLGETDIVEQYAPFGYGTIPPVTTKEPESFPTTLVVAVSGASIAVVGLGLLVYFKKRKR